MSKIDTYRAALRDLTDWDAYLQEHSGLPGPRANLELLQAVVDEGDEPRFRHLLSFVPGAPQNSALEFLAVCGTAGLGKLLAEGDRRVLSELRALATDPRWRIREAVAIALQRWGDADMPALLEAMAAWAHGNPLEQRAAVAALCEPRLLREVQQAARVLDTLDQITASLAASGERKSEAIRVLRQALGYGWSVAVVALPTHGKALMEKWHAHPDPDVQWIVRENLKKDRLKRLDAPWVQRMQQATT